MKVVIDIFCEWTNQSSAPGSARTAWPRAGPCEERHVYAYTRPMHMYKMLYDKCLRTYIIYKTIRGGCPKWGLPPKKHSCFLYFPWNNLSSYWGSPISIPLRRSIVRCWIVSWTCACCARRLSPHRCTGGVDMASAGRRMFETMDLFRYPLVMSK
jgi:hypothetical protein